MVDVQELILPAQPDNVGRPAVAMEDLEVVTQWVKSDLFDKVK